MSVFWCGRSTIQFKSLCGTFFTIREKNVTQLTGQGCSVLFFYVLCFVDRASRYKSGKWPTWRTILFSYMFISILYCNRWSRFETRSEACLAVRQAKITFGRIKYKLGLGGIEFRFGTVRCGYRLQGYCYWVYECVYYAAGRGLILSRVTIISPLWLRGNNVAFSMHDSYSCLCLSKVEVAKLAQAGFRYTSWPTLVWGSCSDSDDNKEVYLLI
jgi:hypothetical protein